ncbi:hypothetical protein LIER_35627 [Lithospermum erythrorhizon]|uniref:Uncharacterized protein n=1 Tax=Lithospermum erythrorhizon TaxID=34254 RepID=A0AAV3NUT4_LITER
MEMIITLWDDALNLNNPAAQRPEDAAPIGQGSTHIGSARTVPEGGCSRPLEMAGLIKEMMDQIFSSVMNQLRDQLPQLRGGDPWSVVIHT